MDWDDLTELEKIERLGKLHFDRHGEEGWEDHNAFYASEDGLVSVVLENEEENEEVDY